MLGQLLRIVYLTQTQPENNHAKLLIFSVPVIGSSVLETAHKHRTVDLKYMIIYMYIMYMYLYIYRFDHTHIHIYGYIIIYNYLYIYILHIYIYVYIMYPPFL